MIKTDFQNHITDEFGVLEPREPLSELRNQKEPQSIISHRNYFWLSVEMSKKKKVIES
jgi:hypothetical protein